MLSLSLSYKKIFSPFRGFKYNLLLSSDLTNEERLLSSLLTSSMPSRKAWLLQTSNYFWIWKWAMRARYWCRSSCESNRLFAFDQLHVIGMEYIDEVGSHLYKNLSRKPGFRFRSKYFSHQKIFSPFTDFTYNLQLNTDLTNEELLSSSLLTFSMSSRKALLA